MKKFYIFSGCLLISLASCQQKVENEEVNHVALTTVQGIPQEQQKAAAPKNLKDALMTDSTALGNQIECYEWANTYLATTVVEDEQGEEYELCIAITLKNEDSSNDYTGTMSIYLAGNEEEVYKGSVTGKAQQNYVTVFFDKNIEGMEEMFKKGDKLVKFEITYGEYVASWFTAMHDYVDEYTILSLQK